MKKLLLGIIVLFGAYAPASAQEFEAESAPVRISLIKDEEPPSVFMTYRNGGRVNNNGKVDVEIRVVDESGIKSVTINGRDRMHGGSKDSIRFNAEFYNEDEILVKAIDNFGNVNDKTFLVRAQAVTSKASHRNYALLLAINDYADPGFEPLTRPIDDATSLKNVLIKKYGFEEANISFLKNPKFEDIDAAFEEMRNKVTSEDWLLIFYAGHGWFDDQSQIGFWYPSDASKTSRARWFRNSALVENIGAINSKHTLLIADACFSGGIFKTRSVNNATAATSNQMKKLSRKAMTSGKLTPVPDNSVFMKYLLKNLEENENKYLSSEDLFDSIKMGMKNNTETKPEYGEIRNTGDEGGDFVFIQNQ